MKIKFSRESTLMLLTVIMIIVGIFYYGDLYFISPLQEKSDDLKQRVEVQENLLNNYPPTDELLEEYEEEYSDIQTFLPFGVKANESHVQLEKMSEDAKIKLVSLSRVNDKELIEDVSEEFLKDTYTARLTADNPTKLRSLMEILTNQDRVWNINSFSYNQSGEENYSADLTYNLYYRIDETNKE